LPQDLFITQQLKSAPVVSGNTVKSQSLINNTTTRDTITVMIVYTPAAALWSRNNETDINNTISQIMTTSQLALDNSNSLITLKLVYSAQVNYTELNNANDLYNLTEFGDGMMEDVHTWRDAYCADVVVLLENIEFTGGLGWQLNSASGLPDYAFSLNRVQQASFSYTTIHEIAHNLGCHHHKQQILEPGPGLNSYSAGWRWTSPSGITYCSVMTSPEGKYFADGKSSIRVPYFSNPDIQYQGIPVGNAVDADNARTLREMKSIVARYRSDCSKCIPPTTQATAFTSSSITDNSMTLNWTRGSGNSVLVVALRGNAVPHIPSSETAYTANNAFGSGAITGIGNYVVYNGTGTSVNLSALSSGTTYHYAIYEYNTASNCYLMPALTGDATTTGTPGDFKSSDWKWQNPYPQGNPLYSVKFLSTDVGWSVGECGTILKTTDGGTTWIQQSSKTTNVLLSVSFTDSNNGTVVGDFGTILKTTNGGSTWSSQSSGTTNALYGIIFTDVNTGTAVGYNGTILKTTNGGTTWIPQSSGTSKTLFGVSFTDSNSGTIVGDEGMILRTVNGGSSWIQQSSGITNRLNGVAFTDTNFGTCVGDAGTILHTTNGGVSWTPQVSGTTVTLYGVCFTDAINGISVGQFGEVLKTTNSGITWSTQLIPNSKSNTGGSQPHVMSVSFTDANTGTAVGGDPLGADLTTMILKTTNGGATWSLQTPAASGRWLNDVSFADSKNGVAVGAEGAIITTNDSGVTWTSQNSGTTTLLNDVSCIDANNWIAVGNRGAKVTDGETLWTATICKTTNAGITWTVKPFPPSTNVFAFTGVVFTDVNHGIIVGGDYINGAYSPLILRTTDGGITWNKQSGGTTRLEAVFFSDSNNGTAVGDNGTILKTTDGGIIWNLQSSGTMNDLLKVHFTDINNGCIVGFFGTILHTTNGGTTWIKQAGGTSQILNDVFFTDANKGTIVGLNGTILKTNNGGLSWTPEPSVTKITLDGLYFFNENNGIIVGQGGAVLKTSGPSCILPAEAGTIIGTASVCQGGTQIIYSVPVITNASSYAWSYSGTGATIGNSSANSIFINFANNATSGNLSVIGINSCGNGKVSANFGISVKPLPEPSGTITGATTVCQGQNSVAYTIPIITNATTYIWSLPSGASGTTTTNSIIANYGASAVSGNISVKGHNDCGDGASSTLAITLNPLPDAAGTITGTAAVCQGQNSVNYTIPAITNTTNYIWTLPSDATGTSTTNSITVNYGASASSGTISVKGHNDCGDGIVSTLAITVNPLPAGAGTITGSSVICQGQNPVSYSVPSISNATSYVWTLPAGATGTSSTNTITVNYGTSAVSGNISVKGHNDCGDGASSTLSITVSPLVPAAGTITGTTTVCQGQNSVSYSVPSISNATSYVWTLPAGATGTSTTNNISVNYGTSAASGNITVEGHNNCGEGGSSTLAITINPKPATPMVTVNANILHSNASNGNQWYKSSSLISGATSQDYTFTAVGDYTVVVTQNGCASDPSVISVVTGIDPLDYGKKISVYPNPVTNELIIESEGNMEKIDFVIVAATGQMVYTGYLYEKVAVPTAGYAPGLYFIKLRSGKIIEFKKIVKL